MKNINQKFYYYSLSKGVTLNLDNKVKFIKSNKNSNIYQIEDNKNIFTVTDYFKDDFLGGLSCDCDLYSISGFCPHTVAILNYKGDIKTTVSKNTLDESFLDSENKLNNSNNFDEDNDNNKGENFDKIFDGLDTLELLEFFKEVLFDNLDIYKQFIKRFRGFDIDVLYDEFIELNTDYLNEDSFIEELSKVEYIKKLTEFISECILEVKSENDEIVLIKLICKIIYSHENDLDDDFALDKSTKILLYFLKDLSMRNINYNELVYEELINNLSNGKYLLTCESVLNYLCLNYLNDEYIDDLKNKIYQMIQHYFEEGNYFLLTFLTNSYLMVLKHLKYDEDTIYNELSNYIYDYDVLLEMVMISLKKMNYDNAIKDIEKAKHHVIEIMRLKTLFLVYKWFKLTDKLLELSTTIIIDEDYIDHLKELKLYLNKDEYNDYINSLYNNQLIYHDTLTFIACSEKNYDKLIEFVLMDKTGETGLRYIKQLKDIKGKELLDYFNNAIIELLDVHRLSDFNIRQISKILYKLDYIRGGAKLGIEITKKLLALDNRKLNQAIKGSIKKYLE